MGDNRDNSSPAAACRRSQAGLVSYRYIVGRADRIIILILRPITFLAS
jgi:hypothetical protein